jgi:sigma-B regulation protein RsbU (phosphoserine phosphatase)
VRNSGNSPARPDRGGKPGGDTADAPFSSLLEDSAEDLYDHAPCGYLSTLLNGTIAKINGTLLGWLGRSRDELVGRCSFSDLLTVGGKLYYETHLAPLLSMQGEAGGLALELKTADGRRLPVLLNCAIKADASGQTVLIRTTIFDARDRRAYERDLLRARQEADRERDRLRELVVTLQRSLLPPDLPAVPGLDAAAHYHVASADEVSGDFYDLFPLSEQRWGVFLGDVCGRALKPRRRTIRLCPGDTLLLYTDGLTEARAPGTDGSGRYGDEALLALVASLAPATADAVVTAIMTVLDKLGANVEDDAAVLALGVPPKGAGPSS